ncbi:FAD-dependent monooxygenase [Variovorax sp. J22P168]|uniref:FAD-dependent monooxygenase n=1 Tax=Variovorax jilinensis TaxID=3053513 RepID=UPI0025767661|nr:FAD-dependent monooxygenase [Variovorax sp. J22P168]MDM0014512.1 FAD-dependent monooxygenase [Variovorax sp. J22P168]
MTQHPVLVVGAGPVGLTMALALRRRGVAVRIVDRAPAPTDKSKALVIWARTLELLDIEGCADVFVAAGLKVEAACILEDHGRELIRIPFAAVRSAYNFALMLPQSETERLLAAQLAALGTTVERQVELLSFAQREGGIRAQLRGPDGTEQAFECAWLVACDGAHSTVRHALGVEFEGETEPSDFLLADVAIDGNLSTDRISICWAPDGILALFPMAGGRFRVIADCGPAAAGEAPEEPTLDEVQRLVDDRGPAGQRLHSPVWLSHFRINERKVREYRHGRVFLAGDAAHVHSPAGGQGMNTGMQDALNLAWKLALVWHGRAAPVLLDSYSPERSAIGDQVLRNAGTMTRMALLRNPLLQEIRRLAVGSLGRIPALRQHMVDQLSETDLHYPHSPLTQARHGASCHPAPGERAPDIGLQHDTGAAGAGRLHEALAGGRFVLLAVEAAPVALPDALTSIAVSVQAAAAAGYHPGYIYLVRPDAYVAACAADGDPEALLALLRSLAP